MPAVPHPLRVFPDPATAPADEPLAWGGDYDPDLLVEAYSNGIFPWPSGNALFWWSPDPRAILPLDGFHASRTLRRTLRAGRLRCTTDTAFGEVVRACAHRPGEGTWIVPPLIDGYAALHALGYAHSVEVWDAAGALVGGVYGIAVGGAFTGESMFHRVTDASKVALHHLVAHLRARGFTLLDVQLPTPHLASLGALEVPRDAFLERLAAAVRLPVAF